MFINLKKKKKKKKKKISLETDLRERWLNGRNFYGGRV